MKRKLLLLLWLINLLLFCCTVHGQTSPLVEIAEVKGTIDPITAQYVSRGIRIATEDGAQCLIIQLDTPGGLDDPMRDIVKAMLASPVPVIVYVAPEGARAASAGLFIVYASHVAAMAPTTAIGAAHPVALGEEMPKTISEKATNDAVAYIRAIAEKKGRNADWAEKAIRESASITAQEAFKQGVIEIVAQDVRDLLQQLDGREIKTAQGTVTLQTDGAALRKLKMNFAETIVHVIINPAIAYLLLTIGIWGLIAEFSAPGISVGGIIGVICLVLFGVAVATLPVNWGGLILIVVAIGLFIADIKAPTHGLLTVGGIAAFVIGSLLLFTPVTPRTPAMPAPEVFRVPLWLVLTMTAMTSGIFLIAVTAGLRAQRLRPVSGMDSLIGARGIATTDCTPYGTVQVKSELWSAVATGGFISAGQPVRVVGREGLKLRVSAEDAVSDQPPVQTRTTDVETK